MVEPNFIVRNDGIVEVHVEPTDGVLDHALNDAVTSRAPRGAARQGLSTYWIDRTERAVRSAVDQGLREPFAVGNVTYLRFDGDQIVAGYEFDPDEVEAEIIPLNDFVLLLDLWRQRVIESGGVSGPDAAKFVDVPAPRPMPPAT